LHVFVSTYIRAIVAEDREVAGDGFAVEVQTAKLGKVLRKLNVARDLHVGNNTGREGVVGK